MTAAILAECATQETWQQDAVVASIFVALIALIGFIVWMTGRHPSLCRSLCSR
jgi:heme/copper-type cytochrome/quinol oxidase subunit 4